MKKCIISFLSLLIGVGMFFPSSLFAATITWNGAAGDGFWSTATNWSSNTIPASTDNVIIPKTFTVTLSGNAGKVNQLAVQGKLIIASTGILNVEQTVSLDPLVDVAGGEVQNDGTLTIKQTIASNTNFALKFTNGTDAGDAKFTNNGILGVDLLGRPAASSVACVSFAQSTVGRTAQFKFGGTMTFNVPVQARIFEITTGFALMDGTYTFGSTADYKNWRFIQLTQGSLTIAPTAAITLYTGYNLAYAGTIASSNSKDLTFLNKGNLTIHGGSTVAGYGIYMNPQNATNACTFTNAGNLTLDGNFPSGTLYMSGGGTTGLVTTYSNFNNQSGATLSLANTSTAAGALVANSLAALTVVFNNAGTLSLTSGSAKNIYFGGSNSTFNNTGTVNLTKGITGNTTATASVINNNAGGVFNFNVSDNAQPTVSNSYKIIFNNNGGTVTGRGVFSPGTFVPLTGILSPGGDSGIAAFTFSDPTLALTGKCNLNVNGTGGAGTDNDQIISTGTLDISGTTLQANIGSGYVPANGDNATLFMASSLTGTFSSLIAPVKWVMNYSATNAVISFGDISVVKKNGIKILLKLDDLQALNNVCPSSSVMDYLIQKQVKAGIGAIAKNFDNTAYSIMSPYLNATNSDGDKLFEVWHHGLDHIDPEFKGTTYAYQKAHFDQATQIIKSLLGVQMHSFGTPFNASDAVTNTVISEDPNYKVFMFPSVAAPASTGIANLIQRVDMENGTGNPDYAYLVTNYNAYKGTYPDYMVLQGHPNQWTAAKIDQFKLIIDYLTAQGCEFVLPYDYYRSLTLSAPTNLQVVASSPTQFNLTWSDNTTSEYNYKIERSVDSLSWTPIATLAENSTSYTDVVSSTLFSYYYRVYANCGIKSGYSNIIKTPNLSTKTVFPTDDVYLYKGTGTTVTGNEIHGMETTLNCYRNPASQDYWWSIPYFKFNLQNITSVIDHVKMRVFGTVKEAHGFDLYTTSLTGWAEDALTYNNVSTETGVVSTLPVASLDVLGSTTAQYYEWDVTQAVNAAIEKGDPSISFKMQDRYAVKDGTGAGIIVQFQSKENLSGNKPQFLISEKNIEPFKLSELKSNGTLIDGFLPAQVRYNVTLPYNTTVIPTITAKAVNPLCTLTVKAALNLTGIESERTTKIVAKIGQDSVSYKVVFSFSADPGDARLDSLLLDKVNIENFNKDISVYHCYLPYTSSVAPVIKAKSSDSFASVSIVQPANLSGTQQERTATVTIVSQNGLNNKTYSVEFEALPKLDIFLALGQSNMSGRGTMVPSDLDPINDVYILTPGANLEIASNPLNKYSSVRKELSLQQMSPSCSFVTTIRDITLHKIGLMQNARGGSAIESWLKGSTDQLYEEALRRALEIKRFGDIKGIIWHQGESNSGDPVGYKTKLAQMVSDFRTDLGIPTLYFVAGEIAQWSGGVSAFNAMIRTISSFIPYTDWATSDGLTPLIDATDPHFDSPSVKILGQRYATKMLAGVYSITTVLNSKEFSTNLAKVISQTEGIKISSVTENMMVNIYDISGRCITGKKLNQNESNTFPLTRGVYIVQLSTAKNTQLEKVVL